VNWTRAELPNHVACATAGVSIQQGMVGERTVFDRFLAIYGAISYQMVKYWPILDR
jgi:hypothetical protein